MEHIRAQEDFDAARAQAFRRAIVPTLTRRFRGMLSMDKVLKAAGAEGRADRGEQEIPLTRIVGSAASPGKASDFDPGFLPVSNRTRDRWTRIYREMAEGGELPPIDVYKLGDNYYVIDGHHRVSVARQLGWDTIKARVVEVQTRAPLGPDVDAEALLRAAEYAGFLEATQLDRVRPGARIQCSRLGRYDEIYQHILGHRYFLGLERGQEVPLPGGREPQELQDVVAGHGPPRAARRHEELGRGINPVDRTGPPLDRRPWPQARIPYRRVRSRSSNGQESGGPIPRYPPSARAELRRHTFRPRAGRRSPRAHDRRGLRCARRCPRYLPPRCAEFAGWQPENGGIDRAQRDATRRP